MTLEASLFGFLTGDAGIAAIVDDRVYPGTAPQGTATPFIIYNKTSRDRQQLFCGTADLMTTQISIDCYANTYRESVLLANLVTDALQDFSGMMGATDVPKVFLTNEIDLSDIEPGLYRQSQTWAFWHRSV